RTPSCQTRVPPIPMSQRTTTRRRKGKHIGGACMNAAAEPLMSTLIVNGVRIELIDHGHGRPILFLHPHNGIDPLAPVLSVLAEGGRLIAPSHPGFGHSERPAGFTTVDDLAYFYLDLMDALDLRDTLVIGISLGA